MATMKAVRIYAFFHSQLFFVRQRVIAFTIDGGDAEYEVRL